ncbi:MAG TPA: SUMF1/EgtB/PvdO family nonheme iron enzyme, partial [Gemmataceae bacterium]|nr:SUMF1/EgtB/PvdO family nonheme iron enzyme [Gemmataceae bacterium]
LTESGAYMGTPDYCAPEQAEDASKADIRADLYSLGCTLYCLLAGHPPFQEDTAMKTALAHMQKEPQPLPELRKDVPASLWQVVKRLLAKDPAQRYQTPNEVFQALSVFVKAGARPNAKTGVAPAPSVGLPTKGTKIIADKKQVKKILREVPGKTPPKKAPVQDGASPFENLVATPALPRKAKGTRESRKRVPALWSRLWPMLAAAGILLIVFLGVWLSSRFKEETPKTITNSIGMKFVFVGRGTFLMGSPENEHLRYPDEFQHEVEITRPFYMGAYEVTQEQYERVMGQNPSWFASSGEGKDKVQGIDTSQFPVETVSWKDTVEFCRRLSKLPEEKSIGRAYRLPTEAEWEYSCRGGRLFKNPSPPFHFGNSLSSTQANFNNSPLGDASKEPDLHRTTKVGSYSPNSLGLYDLHGNVSEWCADWFDAKYYERSPRQNPQGPENGELRVLRGGSWDYGGGYCRAAIRLVLPPSVRHNDNGFRVVLVIDVRKKD